jgi:hypothetical protein
MNISLNVRIAVIFFLLIFSESSEAQHSFDVKKVEFEIRDRWDNFIPMLSALDKEEETQELVNPKNSLKTVINWV